MRTTDTDLAPLHRLIRDAGDVHYGVAVCLLGEDGDTMLAAGHHPRRRAIAAFAAHARWVRYDPTVLEPEAIREVWAVVRRPDPDAPGEDPDATWYVDWSGDHHTPGAVPVTVLAVDRHMEAR